MDTSRIVVVIASAGRPELLGEAVADLSNQTHSNFDISVCVPSLADLPEGGLPDGVLLTFARGAAAQRNAAMDLVPDATYVLCIDDDSVLREDYIEQMIGFFTKHSTVIALTGKVLLDGANGESISRETAEEALRGDKAGGPSISSSSWRPTRELYGCNMAFKPLMAAGQRFDPRLPLYSWLEDHDLCRRLMRVGVVAKVDDCVMVHRGVKSGGRIAHMRLGYAQAMNPAYLWRKGSFPLWLAMTEAGKRVLKNLFLSISPGQAQWRRERLRGNALAVLDIVRGRFTPERMADLPAGDET